MPSLANKVSAFNRKRKWDLFVKKFSPLEHLRVLDVGFSEKEFSDTDNYIEKHFPYPENLTALGVDLPFEIQQRYTNVSFINYDGGIFPFQDKSFDLCWSNAVIEHVGGWEKQLLFLKEIRRVSKKCFITTPNRFFPIEVHTRLLFLHYLPKNIFNNLLILLDKKWASGDYMNLLSLGNIRKLLKESNVSNYRIVKNRLFGFTLDFVIIIDDQL